MLEMRKNHLQKVGMTYSEHFFVSFKISKLFFQSSYLAFVHAIFPDSYITSSTDTIKKVKNILSKTKKKKPF
jgi:hypothetical protein